MNRDDVIRIAREAGYDIEAGHSIRESSDLELFTRFAQLVADRKSDEIIGLLMNDAFAASFQSMGQYRAALVGTIRERGN